MVKSRLSTFSCPRNALRRFRMIFLVKGKKCQLLAIFISRKTEELKQINTVLTDPGRPQQKAYL